MNISYLKKWADEVNSKGLNFKSIQRFEELYQILFKEKDQYLYICMDSKESFLFFDNKHRDFPYSFSSELNNINFHLNHSVLNDLCLIENDRIIKLNFIKWSIYNQKESYNLYLELIPRYQNIILTKEDNEQNIIVECLKKISFAENNTRQILPGSEYIAPNTSFKHIEEDNPLLSVNDYFIDFYDKTILENKKNNLKKTILKQIDKELKKVSTKLSKQESEYKSAMDIEKWQHYIELLKSSYSQIKSGMTEISLTNYFSRPLQENGEFPLITIPLNEKLSPQKNIDFYVKKYKKALNGLQIINNNIKSTQKEINLFLNIKDKISEISDYLDLKDLQSSSLKDKSFSGNEYSEKQMFRKISINEDWEIFIGRSSKENDMLTCKIAKPEDWWFHTRVFHGTHVVLRNYKKQIPPEHLITLCCRIAAWYSKAKHSSNVPVDYTKIRYVRKPRGSAAGYVIYTNQKTYYADPIEFKDAIKYLEKLKQY